MIIPQASFFPLVTCYVASKSIDSATIAKDQLDAKRKATITINVVGSVWNSNISTVDADPADEDINYLMENIELALRSDPNFNSNVTWQRPTGVEYYATILDEQTHLRSGILSLECQVYY
jgi:hypothetical protein